MHACRFDVSDVLGSRLQFLLDVMQQPQPSPPARPTDSRSPLPRTAGKPHATRFGSTASDDEASEADGGAMALRNKSFSSDKSAGMEAGGAPSPMRRPPVARKNTQGSYTRVWRGNAAVARHRSFIVAPGAKDPCEELVTR